MRDRRRFGLAAALGQRVAGPVGGPAILGWRGVVSGLVALAMLLAFGQVVSKAVRVGESRQRAAAA